MLARTKLLTVKPDTFRRRVLETAPSRGSSSLMSQGWWPTRFWSKVDVVIGEVLSPAPLNRHQLQQQVQDLLG